MTIVPLAKYRLNYKSFGSRCQNKEIQDFVDSVLRSFYNLGIEQDQTHKQLDLKDLHANKVYIAEIRSEVKFVLRIINSPFGTIDLYDEDVLRCGYDVEQR